MTPEQRDAMAHYRAQEVWLSGKSLSSLPVAGNGAPLKPPETTGLCPNGYAWQGKLIAYCSCASFYGTSWDGKHDELCVATRVANAVNAAIAEEREACAATVEWSEIKSLFTADGHHSDAVRSEFAAEIRKRGEE